MRKLACATAVAALSLGLVACNTQDDDAAANNDVDAASVEGEGGTSVEGDDAAAGGTAVASSAFPAGTRIIVEDGVTYRVDPSGTRVRLGPGDSRVLVEDGVRFRVDPDGTRVRIDDSGLEIRTDGDVRTGVDADVDATVNASTDPVTNRR